MIRDERTSSSTHGEETDHRRTSSLPAVRFLTGAALLFRPLLLSLVGMVAVGLVGCQSSNNEATDAEAKPIVRTAERGPVKFTLTCNKGKITIAERVKLTLHAEAEENVDVTLPRFGEKLSEFQIRDFTERPMTLVDGVRTWEQVYDLDIFLSGEYVIPALTVQFVDRRERADHPPDKPIEGEVSTEPITINVTSLLEGEFDPAQFRDIKGPVSLPGGAVPRWVLWTGGVTAGVVAVVVLTVILARRRRRRAEAIVVPPHEWAFDQLRTLIDEQLVEQGRVREFHYRLSEITRVYIELRFGLMAPERTTEEFLVEVQTSPALSAEHKRPLADFLQACDLVKFACHQPGNEEIEQVFNTARDFVDQTARPRESQPLEAAA